MKIVFIGDCITTQQAGIHIYAKNLVIRILEKYPTHDYKLIVTKKIPEINCEQVVVPVGKIPFHLRWRQLFTIPSVIKNINPDIAVELAHFGPFNLPASIQRVTVIHDLTPITHPHWHPLLSVFFHKLLMRRIISKASYVITNSDYTSKCVQQYFLKSEKEVLIAYPFLNDLPGIQTKSRVRKNTGKKYFLSVGTIEPRKNQASIIKAFDDFCKKNPDYELIIAGKQGWKNSRFYEILEKSPNRDKIKLLGFLTRAELLEVYERATAFIFASFFEGFGIPILEATFFELPLLLAKNESLSDLFATAALTFEPVDYQMLSQHMLNLASDGDLYQKMTIKSAKANLLYRKIEFDLDPIFSPNFR